MHHKGIFLFTLIALLSCNVSFSQNLRKHLALTTGPAFTSNDFYTVNTVADMHFDVGTGWRFDVQYEQEVYPNIIVFGSIGGGWHFQEIRINQHHRDPRIDFEANLYDVENHLRSYFTASGGFMLKIDESKNQKLQVYLPVGMRNLLGVSRAYNVDYQLTRQSLNFESWFWGLYSGFIIDYQPLDNFGFRISPTYTQFFTQYSHYTGRQHSFDLSVGVVFGF
jgi:hypothetical protein